MTFDDRRGLPKNLQRPRAKNRFFDLFLDAAFSFTGPAQVGQYEGPQRGPRTEEEARRGFATWERVTVNGHSYLVESRLDASSDPNATGSSNGPR